MCWRVNTWCFSLLHAYWTWRDIYLCRLLHEWNIFHSDTVSTLLYTVKRCHYSFSRKRKMFPITCSYLDETCRIHHVQVTTICVPVIHSQCIYCPSALLISARLMQNYTLKCDTVTVFDDVYNLHMLHPALALSLILLFQPQVGAISVCSTHTAGTDK